MNEDYCSYELSKALKACGFNELTNSFYDEASVQQGEFEIVPTYAKFNEVCKTPGCECVAAPTLAHAQKWLREKKGIVVIAEPDWDSEDYCMADYLTGEWYFSVWKDGDRVHCNFDPNAEEERIWMFDKYEQALSAGITSALELIRKGV